MLLLWRRTLQSAAQKVLDECVIVPIYQQEDIHCYTSDLQGFRNGAFQAPLLKYCYFA